MNICPLNDEEVIALAAGTPSLIHVLGDRVMHARKRGLDEKRCVGARWPKRKPEESATDYVGRVAERQLKRQRRAEGRGKGTHRADKVGRDNARARRFRDRQKQSESARSSV